MLKNDIYILEKRCYNIESEIVLFISSKGERYAIQENVWCAGIHCSICI